MDDKDIAKMIVGRIDGSFKDTLGHYWGEASFVLPDECWTPS